MLVAAAVAQAGFVAGQPISLSDSDQFASELMFNCPTDGNIRVADGSSISRFQSLKGCAQQVIIAPPEPINRPDFSVPVVPTSDATEGGSGPLDRRDTRKIVRTDGAKAVPAVIRIARPLGEDENRMISIAPDALEMREWEELAAIVPTSVNAGTDAAIAARTVSASATASPILALRPRSYATAHDDLITQVAVRHAIDPLLLHAVIKQESGYRAAIRSHAGAVGLMQIMPGTGRMLGVAHTQLTDPSRNVDAGARLLRQLYAKYGGNFDLVLAAYNAGEGAVQRFGNRIPPYRETQDYVRSVKANYVRLARENGYAAVGF